MNTEIIRNKSFNSTLFTKFSLQIIAYLVRHVQAINIKSDNSGTQIKLKTPKHLSFVTLFLKKSTLFRFDIFIDIAVRHYLSKNMFFMLDYIFSSHAYNTFIRLTLKLNLNQVVESISPYYHAAVWAEREVFDLFGIFFYNNKDLRKILTDYGFKGNPLKKDYPLVGYYDIFYSESTRQLKVSDLSNAQILNKKYSY